MRLHGLVALMIAVGMAGAGAQGQGAAAGPMHVGFDRNEFPANEATLLELRRRFEFVGYWLNAPPGEKTNSWAGKRDQLKMHGFGFLVLYNGKLDAQILAAGRRGVKASALGAGDGADALAAARREGFPAGAIVFLDMEEGGRMLAEQADYLFGWTEAVSAGGYRAGVYCSGQPVKEERGKMITTAEDIREQVVARKVHEVALWVAQDSCGPSPGCVVAGAPAMEKSGTVGAVAWQYAQSPRRRNITAACAKTYAVDGNCYAAGVAGMFLDLNVATSADPSHGR